jgi:hypothetical protein
MLFAILFDQSVESGLEEFWCSSKFWLRVNAGTLWVMDSALLPEPHCRDNTLLPPDSGRKATGTG